MGEFSRPQDTKTKQTTKLFLKESCRIQEHIGHYIGCLHGCFHRSDIGFASIVLQWYLIDMAGSFLKRVGGGKNTVWQPPFELEHFGATRLRSNAFITGTSTYGKVGEK